MIRAVIAMNKQTTITDDSPTLIASNFHPWLMIKLFIFGEWPPNLHRMPTPTFVLYGLPKYIVILWVLWLRQRFHNFPIFNDRTRVFWDPHALKNFLSFDPFCRIYLKHPLDQVPEVVIKSQRYPQRLKDSFLLVYLVLFICSDQLIYTKT